jgi:hypothetical protein
MVIVMSIVTYLHQKHLDLARITSANNENETKENDMTETRDRRGKICNSLKTTWEI